MNLNKILIGMNITPELSGYRYLLDAVPMVSEDPTMKCMVLYHTIAKQHNTTEITVEICIRYAISIADKESDYWKKYIMLKKCANLKFIRMLAETMRLEEENADHT